MHTDQLEIQHIVRLFSRMLHLYGNRWANIYGPATSTRGEPSAAAKQWLYDLRDLTPDELARGVEAVVVKRMEWPPGPIELLNLCEGVPTLAEVLDFEHDYGPLCKAIRSRMDWFQIDSMPSKAAADLAKQQLERVVVSLRRAGTLRELSLRSAAAIGSAPEPAAIGMAP